LVFLERICLVAVCLVFFGWLVGWLVFVGLGFEIWALHLQKWVFAKQMLYPLNQNGLPVHFALVIFGDGVFNYLPRLASNYDPTNLSFPSS
jgi:hypothetical protein